jgi:hypothetical protein
MKGSPIPAGTIARLLVGATLLGAAAGPSPAQEGAERNVYFGEQHLHTSWSFDAFAFGDTLTGPEEFYQYARGEPTLHPGGYEVQITKPLDWGASTEHSVGMVQEAMDPTSPLRKTAPFLARVFEAGVRYDGLRAFEVLSLGSPRVIR